MPLVPEGTQAPIQPLFSPAANPALLRGLRLVVRWSPLGKDGFSRCRAGQNPMIHYIMRQPMAGQSVFRPRSFQECHTDSFFIRLI